MAGEGVLLYIVNLKLNDIFADSLLNVMKDFLNPIWKDITEFFERYFIVISILCGIALLVISYFIDIGDAKEKINKLLYTIGSISLTSGVFAGIAKSNQFKEIYKKLLRDIIYCNEHLEKRSDLEVMWEAITATLTNKKFEKISNLMNENIKKYFLPLQHDYYYDNFSIDINIEKIEGESDFYIFTEVTKYSIICEDEKLKISNKYLGRLRFNPADTIKPSYKLKKLSINNQVQTDIEVKTYIEKNKYISSYEKPLVGFTKYDIIREDEKIYNINYNNLRRQLAVWIYHNCQVDITYPKDLDIEFYELGVLNDFIKESKSNANFNRLKAEYKGLIYKNQGFLLDLSKI